MRSGTCRCRCRRVCCACSPKGSSTASAARPRSASTCASSPPRTRALEDRLARGLFREDLYHRLNVIRIELPPLRARGEDIPDLLKHYMLVAAAELGVEPKALAPEALARLAAHDWPGNVRELVNLCRRLSVLAPGSVVHLADLPPELTSAAGHTEPAGLGDGAGRLGAARRSGRRRAAARCGAAASLSGC